MVLVLLHFGVQEVLQMKTNDSVLMQSSGLQSLWEDIGKRIPHAPYLLVILGHGSCQELVANISKCLV